MNRGLILEPLREEDYVFGISPVSPLIGSTGLQPDGDWEKYVPTHEAQFNDTLDSMSCVSFGTTNAIETLIKRVFGLDVNYSDRALSKMSGTTEQGNSPKKVADTIRKQGLVPEMEWPFTSDIKTFAEFMAELPQRIKILAASWVAEYVLHYEVVNTHPAVLKEALKHSPLGVSNNLFRNADGTYSKPKGQRDLHWATLIGEFDKDHWKLLDHYPPYLKKVRKAEADFEFAYRYAISRQVKNEGLFALFLKFIRHFVYGEEKPAIAVQDHTVPRAPAAQDKLLEAAKSYLGKDASPLNEAPSELACAETVSFLLNQTFGNFPKQLSTIKLKAQLDNDNRFTPTTEYKAGVVVVSPTQGKKIGHAGICLSDTRIASNNSFNGKFEDNYSVNAWKLSFEMKQGLSTFLYAPV